MLSLKLLEGIILHSVPSLGPSISGLHVTQTNPRHPRYSGVNCGPGLVLSSKQSMPSWYLELGCWLLGQDFDVRCQLSAVCSEPLAGGLSHSEPLSGPPSVFVPRFFPAVLSPSCIYYPMEGKNGDILHVFIRIEPKRE